MVRIIRRSGRIEERGESLGEFRARLTADRISRRGLSRTEQRQAREAGVTQQQIVQSLQQRAATAKPLQVPKGAKIVRKRTGELVFQRIIRTRQGLNVVETPVSSIRKDLSITQITVGKEKKPVKLFLDTASGTLLESLTRTGVTVPIPAKLAGQQREAQRIKTILVGAAKTIQGKFRDNGDLESARRINKLVEKGLFTKAQRKAFENKLKKQEQAIKKIELVNKKIEGFNKNYDKSVKSFFSFLNVDPRTGKRVRADDFSTQVARRVAIEGSKLLNPIIVGTEIGAFLENFRTAKEAGLTSIPKVTKKFGRALTDPDKIISAFNSLGKALDPRTVNGLSNIIILLLLIGVPTKTLTRLGKFGRTGSQSFFKANKGIVQELRRTVRALARDKTAALRGAKRITAKVSKAELRKRNLVRQLGRATRQQAKGFARTKAERKALLAVTKRKPAKDLVLIQTKTSVGVFRGKTRQPLFSVKVKGKPLFTKQAKSVVSKSTKNAFKGSGRQVLLTVQKQSKRAKRRIKGKKKATVVKQAQKIDKKAATRTFESLSGKRSPQATVIYEDFVAVPPETLTRGWRSAGIKNQIVNRLNKVSADLKVKKALEIKKAVVASKVAKKVDELKLRSLLQKSTLSFSSVQGVFRLVTSPSAALKLNNSLRLISLLNFSIARVNVIQQNVQSIPIAVLKPAVKIEFIIIDKEKIKKPIPRPTPKKPKRRLPPSRRVVTPRPPRPVPRRLPKPIRKKKIVKKRRLLPPLRLRRLKPREVKIIRAVLKVVPKKFRPSLKAVVLGIVAAKIPRIITGLELRPIIVKLIKEKEEELKKKLKKLKKGVKKRGKKRKVKRTKSRRK